MNIRDLRYFLAVAEHQHFGKAASKCFVSQPTLSGQIKKLEEELNLQLFERSNKKVEVTPDGEAVIIHARHILEEVEAIHELALSRSDPMAGDLRIGMIPTIAPYLMPLILQPMKDQYPDAKMSLSEDITEHLNTRLKNRQIDIAVLATPVTDTELESLPLYDEPFWLAHHRDETLYDKDSITESDLACMNLLLLDDGHCLTHQVMNVCRLREDGVSQSTDDLRAASLETLLQLVAAGYGATLVPALAIRGAWMTDMGIIARQIDAETASRRVSLVFRKTYPRKEVINILADLIQRRLPNTVAVIQ